ncbi:MAG: twin-arginine translocase subunit TatC [Actinomycetota bacterium]|nr:twin-arginine translocase subunit TatC [Actinomycetota bacterium]
MTLLEHLAELRKRLIICIVAVVIGTLIGFFLYNAVIAFIAHPYHQFALKHPNKVIGPGGPLVVNGPLEGFSTRLKVAAYLGIFFSSPILLWELWRFITPGLHKHERKYAISFVLSALALFSLGVTVSVLVWPKALDFLIRVGGNNIAALYGPAKYVSLYVAAAAIFGVVFLFPVVLVFLEVVGLVTSTKLRKVRRPAIIGIAVLATIATPSNDPYSFVAMAIPLYVFYEVAIIIGRILKK